MSTGPYRQPAPIPPDPYLPAWARLRRRRLGLRAALLGFFLLLVPAIAISLVPAGLRLCAVALGLTLAIPAALLILSLLPPFLCPRCERPFFVSVSQEIGSSSRCVHCGLVVRAPARTAPPMTDAAPLKTTRVPIATALRRFLLTVAAALVGYGVVREVPALGSFVLSMGIAGASTLAIAHRLRSRSFSRILLIPVAALTLASITATRATRLEETRFEERVQWIRRGFASVPRCSPSTTFGAHALAPEAPHGLSAPLSATPAAAPP